MQGYRAVYEEWRRDPQAFWGKAAADLDWIKPPSTIFDGKMGVYGRWFPGALCNTCHNALDRHVAGGRAAQAAILYDSPVTGTKRRITYGELLDEVATFAAVLAGQGIKKGDRVIVYMPMIPEAVVAMLAIARLGAIHSVVFGGFASAELATRIDHARPKLIVTASCGIEPTRVIPYMPLVDGALELTRHKPDAVIIVDRERHPVQLKPGRDFFYADAMAKARAAGQKADCVPVDATDPLYILYTSGTTGQPKGVVHDNGGHMVALYWSMRNVYGIKPGETFWAAADIGWAVGHSYGVYGPLLYGCTTILYEGKPVGTPDAGAFWRVIAEYKAAALFTAPTAFRAIKKEDPEAKLIPKYDLSSLRTLFLAGERADPDTIQWAERNLKVPVVDHWWQTETGWAITANPVGLGILPVKYGSASVPMPGYAMDVLDDAGHPVAPGKLGNIVVKLPLPPCCLPTLWENDERFRQSYLTTFPGYYQTADAGYIDAEGYVFVMARTDDVINVAGHRLSTGALEEVLAGHPAVAECAVIGVHDELKGQIPVGFVVIKSGIERSAAELEPELVALIREKVGAVASLKTVLVVPRLPKTRSGKVLRGTMRQIADHEEYKMPATIEDPGVLTEIASALKGRASA